MSTAVQSERTINTREALFVKEAQSALNTKVLIVDDDVTYTKALQRKLGAKGNYNIRVENDPRLAKKSALTFSPDIVFLDVMMPYLNGSEVYAQFSADARLMRIPIIFVTAIVGRKEVEYHHGYVGGCFYVAKPIDPDGLVAVINKHLHREPLPSDDLRRQVFDLSVCCPFDHENPCACPLFAVRKMSVGKRYEWLHKLSDEEIRQILTFHETCLSNKLL